MNQSIPVEIIYGLCILFTVLSILFLRGKGSSLFVGHNTTKEPAFQPVKLCKALGVCFAGITLLCNLNIIFDNRRKEPCNEW